MASFVGGELFTDYSITLANLSRQAKLKSTGAGRFQLLSRWWDAYRKQLGLKDFSPKKSGRCGIAALRSVALYLWLIISDIKSGNRPLQQYLGFTAGLVMVSSSIRLTAWLQNSKRAERRDWCMSRVTAIISLWLSASSSACHGLLIITRDNAITYKAQWQKCRELKLTQQYDMQMRQRDVRARCKIRLWC